MERDLARLNPHPAMHGQIAAFVAFEGNNGWRETMKLRRNIPVALLGLTLLHAAPAFAGQCEDSFDRQAKILGHMQFSAQVELPGLTVASAFSQLRTILPTNGIRIVQENAGIGQINAETAESIGAKGQPVDIFFSNAAGRGLVHMTYSRKTNLLRGQDRFRDQMCAILNQLTVNGVESQRLQNGAAPIRIVKGAINVDSIQLSQQVRATADNPARLRALFEGHDYAVTGRIAGITEPKKRHYVVAFEGDRMDVLCKTGKKQDRAVALFEVGRRETLVGKFKGYDDGGKKGTGPAIVLEDCKAP